MKPYSVLLLYPLVMTDGEIETFYSFVEADDPPSAVHAARLDAVQQQATEGEYVPSDFGILLITEGHHTDYSYKEEEDVPSFCGRCGAPYARAQCTCPENTTQGG